MANPDELMRGTEQQANIPTSVTLPDTDAGLRIGEIWSRPLPGMPRIGANLGCRLLVTLFRKHLRNITGLEHVQPRNDPFIVALNHGSRLEALAVPAALAFHREGRLVHFFSDWNYLIIPGLGFFIRQNEPIVVTRKPARPRVLNLLRPFYTDRVPSMERGRRLLEQGRSVGIFPEGTVNRHQDHLMRGDRGAAWLSLLAGVPVVPAGIRFPVNENGTSGMVVEFGRPMRPDPGLVGPDTPLSAAREWHACIMQEISRLSRKTWNHQMRRTKHV